MQSNNIILFTVVLLATAASAQWYKPPARLQWQWQLSSPFTAGNLLVDYPKDFVTLYEIDLFDNTKATIDFLHSKGKKVTCYFEAGTWVKERPFSALYPTEAIGKPYEAPYENELWLDIRHPGVRDVIKNKVLPLAKQKGCDAVGPDNVQGYERDSYCTGFESCETKKCTGPNSNWDITKVCKVDYEAWLDFNKFLAAEAHALGMAVALKNNKYQASALVLSHDFVLSEQCLQYKECDDYKVFVSAGKPVLLAEYRTSNLNATCKAADSLGFSAMKKTPRLVAKDRKACCGPVACGVEVALTSTVVRTSTVLVTSSVPPPPPPPVSTVTTSTTTAAKITTSRSTSTTTMAITTTSPTRTTAPATTTTTKATTTSMETATKTTTSPSPPAQTWFQPAQRVQWQWQLTDFTASNLLIDTAKDNVTIYDIDLYTPKAQLDFLKSKGKKIVCYFEAGTWVKERPFASLYPVEAIGNSYEAPYENELWLDVRHPGVRDVIKNKIFPFAKQQGCDALEPDNTQGFERDSYCTGFESCETTKCTGPNSTWDIARVCKADYDAWLDFNRFMATEAHALGMGIAMKNNRYQASTLVDLFDFVLSEECLKYNECTDYSVFVRKGKAVLLTEYGTVDMVKMCANANTLGFSAMRKTTSLTATDRRACCGAVPC
ncbi:hypothetical protein HDU67_000395 [Dinochytrium kinnereticum]|nr:hypothetical protein HDU67_000395 [Dinochytrium kinnereticum]